MPRRTAPRPIDGPLLGPLRALARTNKKSSGKQPGLHRKPARPGRLPGCSRSVPGGPRLVTMLKQCLRSASDEKLIGRRPMAKTDDPTWPTNVTGVWASPNVCNDRAAQEDKGIGGKARLRMFARLLGLRSELEDHAPEHSNRFPFGGQKRWRKSLDRGRCTM
jgi:hypothetical protein